MVGSIGANVWLLCAVREFNIKFLEKIETQPKTKAKSKQQELNKEMLEMLNLFSMLNDEHYKDIAGLILKSRELITKVESNGL